MALLILEELIIETLQWLPVKSLLRFRCISKSLREVIDSPNFINSHLSKSSHTRKLIFQSRKSPYNFHVCDVNVNLEEESLSRPQKSFSFPWNDFYVGYCNGLFLLFKRKSRLALWNPSTRQCRDLPVCPCEEVLPNVHSYHLIASGLGYDDSVDDYKALLVVFVREKPEFEFEIQVWIYGLKSNIWRRSQNFPHLKHGIHIDVIGYFADGNLYFLRELINGWKQKIVAFDIRKETFSFVPQPVCSVSSINGVVTELHVLGGCLCISYFSKSMPAQADFYIRKKDGIGLFTWTKLFSVTDPVSIGGVKERIIGRLDCVNVLGYAKRGDKILLDLISFREGKTINVVLYDLKERSFVKVETDKDPLWDDCSVLCLQVESLVSVGGGATV